jgi:hypothetical protein
MTLEFTSFHVILLSLKINLVPRTRIELVMTGYQPIVIPFNYPGKLNLFTAGSVQATG